MNAIRLFFKRLYWRYMFQMSTKTELVNMIMTPDKDVPDLLRKIYILQMSDIRELMVIVYDDKFHETVRLVAGWRVLELLKEPFGFMFLPDSPWTSTKNGRLAYLVGVGLYLPKLRRKANAIVERFYPHERRAFVGAW